MNINIVLLQLAHGFCILRKQVADAAFRDFKLLIQQLQALGELQAYDAGIPVKPSRQPLVSALDVVNGSAFIGN